MTPQEKARELVDTYYFEIKDNTGTFILGTNSAKQCALIAVDEVISNIEPSVSMDVISARIKYWEQVKTEIEKL
jgi:hypothetical protein